MDVTLFQENIVQSHGLCTTSISVGEKREGQTLENLWVGYWYIKVYICHKRQNLSDGKCPMNLSGSKITSPPERLDITPSALALKEK
jgi:hypothetical protein